MLMSDDRQPWQLLYGQLHASKRLKHKLQKRYKDYLKSTLVNIKRYPDDQENLALSRTERRIHVDDSCTSSERERIEHVIFRRKTPS